MWLQFSISNKDALDRASAKKIRYDYLEAAKTSLSLSSFFSDRTFFVCPSGLIRILLPAKLNSPIIWWTKAFVCPISLIRPSIRSSAFMAVVKNWMPFCIPPAVTGLDLNFKSSGFSSSSCLCLFIFPFKFWMQTCTTYVINEISIETARTSHWR